MRTDTDSRPIVLIRGSALAALLAVHTQPTGAPWLRTSSNRAQGTLKLMRWRWRVRRRSGHGGRCEAKRSQMSPRQRSSSRSSPKYLFSGRGPCRRRAQAGANAHKRQQVNDPGREHEQRWNGENERIGKEIEAREKECANDSPEGGEEKERRWSETETEDQRTVSQENRADRCSLPEQAVVVIVC
ncbi:hypothetical protein M431DRAFT_320600 [Trichoderma harzianum CBS 226.95]|uniref:Uncharacterized protein n=1 Tax=Trichoderma harzianum CBS 226.95 TaxID=983964 RepID=A0A2T3ZW48_TRIHA|nr:hypothetical protein M431DRAFT_320600 [Trichoderma harzianum CBS 226.95]PTB49039.1 hypothetical protein M431DRAFT_320600 [Trichoderma harzianum CBS 226.95]